MRSHPETHCTQIKPSFPRFWALTPGKTRIWMRCILKTVGNLERSLCRQIQVRLRSEDC
ncbi:hypothetical protein H6F50_02380 [Coleofasciculus sp. FACHB-712]|nr:hypothetical protein [Coleofasciculus sp. FACHB-712]